MMLPEQEEKTMQQSLDLTKSRDDVSAAIADTTSRLRKAMAERDAAPVRIATQRRSAANQYSVERISTMLAELRNKQTDLAAKFLPTDRIVIEANQQVTDTEAALIAAKALRAEDHASDVNHVRQALESEVNSLRSQLAGLQSRVAELDVQVGQKREELARMEAASVQDADMQRNIKEATDNYALSREKAEEASVAESLDRALISNVVIAAQPTLPALPLPTPLNLLTGGVFCLFLALAAGLIPAFVSDTVYDPAMLEAATQLPVLATLPRVTAG